jgi:Aldo/keto reductase family
MKLDQYVTLGRSGLCVSPLCLRTMTFGTEWGWGADDSTSAALLDRYLAAGGNFVDTADFYTDGNSEEILGRLISERKVRDRVVLATKFTFNPEPGNPQMRAEMGVRTSTEPSKGRSGVLVPTTSTCTGCTPGIRLPQSMRFSRRSMNSCNQGKSATMVLPMCQLGTRAALRRSPNATAKRALSRSSSSILWSSATLKESMFPLRKMRSTLMCFSALSSRIGSKEVSIFVGGRPIPSEI